MGSTPILDVLATYLPAAISAELSALSSPQSRSTIENVLCFALGADCPTRLANTHQEWLRTQPIALEALQGHLGTKFGAKRARDSVEADDNINIPKRQKTVPDIENGLDDPPRFTLPSISTTSPVRKKVDVTVHVRSIRFVSPSTRALEATVSLTSLSRAFLLPTRGKSRGHWTVVLLPTDIPDKAKVSPPWTQQVIFGLDALSPAMFETTSYTPGTSTTTTTFPRGKETVSALRQFLSHIPVPLYEPTATVFRSACATAKAGDGAAGVDAYLSAKPGTLWFLDTGILWGESKPCEFWAISDLAPKDGVRMISATGRTCSIILSRKSGEVKCNGPGTDEEGKEEEIVETEFSMVDGREQDPIQAWARNRKHLLGKPPAAAPSISIQSLCDNKGKGKDVGPVSDGTVQGPAWDDSDPDDEDFETSSEDLGDSTGTNDSNSDSDLSGSEDVSGSQSDDEESGGEEDAELRESHHPLLRRGAMPRMSKAALDAVVDMLRRDLPEDESDEEDELDE